MERPDLIKLRQGKNPRNNAVIPVAAIFVLLSLTIILISIHYIFPPFIWSLGALSPAPL